VDVADMVGNADLLVELQDNVQAKLTQRLEDALGNRFFCAPTFRPGGDCGDPTFVIKRLDVPTSVAKAFEDVRTSEIQIQTKENEVRQREAEARAIAALGLSGQEYDILKAIESGKITFWVLDGQGGITITGPDTGAGGGSTVTPSTPSATTTTTTTAPRRGGGGGPGGVTTPPDIVLFLTDQQRFDQLGYSSGGHFQTPNLDRLARSGVIFENAYSASTVCVPSRVALMTGIEPHRVPTQENPSALREGFWTVAHELRRAGYQTALIGKAPFAPVHAQHGFETLRLCEHLSAQGLGPLSRERGDEVDDYHDWLLARGYSDWRSGNPGDELRIHNFPPGAYV